MLSLVPTFTPPPARSVNTNITVYERLKHLLTVNNSKTNIVSNYSRLKPKYQSANITSINNTTAHSSTIEKDNFTLFDDELIVQDTSVIHKDDNSNTVSSIFSNRKTNSLAYSSSSMLSGIPLFDLTSHNVTTTADIEDVNNTITITRSTVPATSLMMGMGPPKSDYTKACPPVQSSNDNTNINMKLKTTINVNNPISNSTATTGGHASVSKRKADDFVDSRLELEELLRGSTSSSSSNPRKKMAAAAVVDKSIGKSIVGDDSLGNKENKSYNAKQNQSDWKQHSAASSSAVESHMKSSSSIINGPVMNMMNSTAAARHSSSCHDFCGIEQFCRNAGTSALSLRTLLNKVTHAGSICFSVLWRCLQTNHVTSTVKFCTASSQCINWHCTCDHQVRADYACNNILGVIIYIPNESTNSMMGSSSSGSNEMVYFIPLVPCLAMDSISEQDGDGEGEYGYVLPLRCGTTLVDRWEAVMSIMGNSNVLKVNFNSQLSLLPLMKYVDSAKTNGSKTDIASTNPLNTTSLSSFTGLFDVRLAAYLCDSTILEERLELEVLLQHSSIVVPSVDVSGLGAIARAIGRARAELRCVYELYVMLDHQLVEKRLRAMFIDLEMPTACLLCSMECLGIKVNRPYLDSIRRTIVAHIEQLEASIYQSVGGQHFNISSPEQVSHMLFEVLKLPTPTNHSKKGRLDVVDDDVVVDDDDDDSLLQLLIATITLIIRLSIIHPSMHSTINPSTHQIIYSSIHRSVHPSIKRSIHTYIHISIHSPIHPSIYSSIHLCIYASIYSSILLSIYSSIHPSIPSGRHYSTSEADLLKIKDAHPSVQQILSFRALTKVGRKIVADEDNDDHDEDEDNNDKDDDDDDDDDDI